MNRFVPVAIVGLIAGALVAYAVMAPRPAAVTNTVTTGKALVGGPFTLVDQSGKTVTDRDFRGKHMLIFFGFTNCPDICPAGLQVITQALAGIGSAADKVTPLFLTLDPERDTPEVMAKYVASFDPRIVGLTGSPEQVGAVAKAYRVYSKKIGDDPAAYTLDHTSIVYLMDPDGSFIRPFAHGTSADKMAEALRKELG